MEETKKGEIVIYKAEQVIPGANGRETIWLSQAQMAELFGKDRDTISEHIQNIFKEAELSHNSVARKFRVTARDGKSYEVNYYNLDVVISVGYRVNPNAAPNSSLGPHSICGIIWLKAMR